MSNEEKKVVEKEIKLTEKQLIAINKTTKSIQFHEGELNRAKLDQSQLLELILEFNKIENVKSVEIINDTLKVTIQ